MKKTYFISILSLIIVFSACEKGSNNISVDDYIDQLKAGEYKEIDLPAFDQSDIIYLLEYRDDTSVIRNFPVNMASSFYLPECQLGIYVLWTVESIREIYNDSENLIGSFPSLNPILYLREGEEAGIRSNDESLEVAARAYYEWWQQGFLIKRKMESDPLEGTPYTWH